MRLRTSFMAGAPRLLRHPLWFVQSRACVLRAAGNKRSRGMAAAAAPSIPQSLGRTTDYDDLCKRLKELSTLAGVSGLLMWDEMVMMPPGAAAVRGAQKSALTGVLYDKIVFAALLREYRHALQQTSEDLGRLLEKVRADQSSFDDYQAAVVREAGREFKKATAVPKHIETRRAELESEGYQAWVAARQASDFGQFVPALEEWVSLTKQRCECIEPGAPTYDVALQDFEKGMTSARLDEVFQQLKEGLVPFIRELKDKGTPPDAAVLGGEFDAKVQADLCNRIATDLGFDLQHGRLDVSVHPFTGGAHPTDVRMTTRFKPDDLTEGLTGAIHETGHALYEQARNLEYDGLPVNEALSMGVHESQSLLWERMVALSEPFAAYLTPLLKKSFPQLPSDLSPEQVHGALNVLKVPSFVRVEADEVQYPLHVLLRYEIEKSLADGSLAVKDIPSVWNSKMQEYLGVTPDSDAKGCLQDMHWSAGAFAYFPTYTLGAMYACQLFQVLVALDIGPKANAPAMSYCLLLKAAQKDLPDLDASIAAGKFEALREWLREKVHKKGSLYASGDELMLAATGSALDPGIFLTYLREKYSKLYKL